MSDEFLNELREEPRPEFARALRERLHGLEATGRRSARLPTPALATAATLVVLAVSFAFPGVRATASAILDLFRARDVVAITFDPERVEPVRAALGTRSPVLLLFGEPVELADAGEPVVHHTPEDAAAAGLALPPAPPGGVALERVEVAGPRHARLEVDRDRLHETFDRLDLEEVGVPRELAEGSLELSASSVSTFVYTGESGWARWLVTERLSVERSPGFDLELFGEIGLRVVGVEAEQAHRLAGSIDWPATLLVPMPIDAASFREVVVRGENALLVSGPAGPAGEPPEHALLWSEGSRAHGISGNLSAEDLLRWAEASWAH